MSTYVQRNSTLDFVFPGKYYVDCKMSNAKQWQISFPDVVFDHFYWWNFLSLATVRLSWWIVYVYSYNILYIIKSIEYLNQMLPRYRRNNYRVLLMYLNLETHINISYEVFCKLIGFLTKNFRMKMCSLILEASI